MLLIEFFNPNCRFCKQTHALIDELSKETNAKIQIKRIDTSKSPDLSQLYNVRAVPTLILMENGLELRRSIGAKTKAYLKDFLALA